MTQALVLALPNFQKTFVVETDASGPGIGVVLQQEGHLIAYLTKWLPKLLGYENEISYKKGSDNVVADTLSRISYGNELNSFVLSTITSELLEKVKDNHEQDNALGHSCANVTAHKIGTLFYLKGMHKMVKKLIRECDTFQRQKVDLFAYLGHLNPLPIHEKVWSDISMDFIVGLLKSQGKTIIFVVVDRLSKYAHFMAHSHPYTTSLVA
ncbi:retrotransposon-related protein [Tanacetum coccineum]